MRIILGIFLALMTTNVLAEAAHVISPGAKSVPPPTAHSLQPASIAPEQTVVLTLSSLRHIVMTQCQAMMAERDAQQTLADAMRAPAK